MPKQSYNLPIMALSSGFVTVSVPALTQRKMSLTQTPQESVPGEKSTGEVQCYSCFIVNSKFFKHLHNLIVRSLTVFTLWATSYVLFGDTALPNGSIFVLAILVPLGIILGNIADKLHLPPMVGMLLAGLILANVPYINIAHNLSPSIAFPLRSTSIVVLLARGALSVNTANIRNYIRVVPLLAVGCCVMEGLSASIAVYFIIGFQVHWSILMGCIMSAMTGVGVMPYLMKLSGNPQIGPDYTKSIVIAKTACGLDAILGICMAEVALGFMLSHGEVNFGLMKGLLELLVGAAFGTLWGTTAGILLNKNYSDEMRTVITFCGGIMSLLGLYKINYGRGGPLATFMGTFIAASFFRSRETDGSNNKKLNEYFIQLWYVFQPLLFGIIGARTDLSSVDWRIIGLGIGCLCISLSVRMLTAFLACGFLDTLTIRERIFIALAWIPKGTVQAALGPVALDTCRDFSLGEDYETVAHKIMNLSVAIILVGSILGGIVLTTLVPKILKKS